MLRSLSTGRSQTNSCMSKASQYFGWFRVATGLLLVSFIVSCTGTRELATVPGKNAPFLIRQMKQNHFQFRSLTAKVNSKITFKGKSFKFKSAVRMRKDSLIWISMSPAMGVEAARAQITPDSLKFINRFEKTYWSGSFRDVRHLLKAEVNFSMLQDFMVGNAVGFDYHGKYRSSVEDSARAYLLTSKSPKKVRKAIAFKESETPRFNSDSLMELSVHHKRLEKAIIKVPEDQLLVLRYWLEPMLYRPQRVLINDLKKGGVLDIQYGKLQEVETQWMPYETTINITDQTEEARLEMSYSKVKLNRPVRCSFTINEKYTRVVVN